MNIYNSIQLARGNHVQDVGYSLQPLRVDGPVRRLSGEMVRPGNFARLVVDIEGAG